MRARPRWLKEEAPSASVSPSSAPAGSGCSVERSQRAIPRSTSSDSRRSSRIGPEFVAGKVAADFVTSDYRELLARPEVTAAIVATDEHFMSVLFLPRSSAGYRLLIEKPLATELAESERVLEAIQKSGVDAVVGYTQRFRRRWLMAKEKVRTGQLGDVTLVTSRRS